MPADSKRESEGDFTCQGPVYTKRQRQRCNSSAMTLAILFSLKTMESLQNLVATHSQASLLISMRTELLASLQSGRSIDADVWCKRALNVFHGKIHFCMV